MSKYKFLISSLMIIVFIYWYNAKSLREVSNLEKKLEKISVELEDNEKKLDKKIITYNEKLNLSKIRKNMENKGMKVANDVIYFEVEKEN